MVRTLVVMRHGKAMPAVPDQSDFDRRLMGPGKHALSTQLPDMLGLLKQQRGTVQIWASPARRALQTAELLVDALKKRGVNPEGEIEQHECLYEQDIEAFLRELCACEADTVYAVGHVPFAEDIVETLVGSTPPFSTGALACLRVKLTFMDEQHEDVGVAGSRLRWFVQGPRVQDEGTLDMLQDALIHAAENVEQRRAAFFDDPRDIETMHKFRVSMRTLRSLIAFIKPWQNAAQNAKAQELLKEIVAYTSRQRELDVFEKQARLNETSSPDLLEFCRKEACSERKNVIKALSSKRLTKSFEGAIELAQSIQWKDKIAAKGIKESDVRAHFDEMVKTIQADLDGLKLSDAEQTHDVRKRAKRVRYAAENFEDILGEDAVDVAKGMTAHQDNLGDVCDARVNIELINEFLQRDLPEPVVWDLTLLRAQNEIFLCNALKADEETNGAAEG